jgi:hypothetical protein
VVRDASSVAPGAALDIQVAAGRLTATVDFVERKWSPEPLTEADPAATSAQRTEDGR